jgi:hypothetical protein
MKQFLAVLAAALFAAASVNAVAQEKKGDGMEKKAMKSDTAKAKAKKAAPKKTAKKTQKKGEDAKK